AGGIIFGAQQNWQQLGLGGDSPELAKQAPVVSQPSIVNQPVMAVGVNANRSAAPVRVNRSPMPLFVPRGPAQLDGQRAVNEQEIQGRLNALMLEHANNAATNTGRGVLPYARIPKLENPIEE
ncbi:MAG: hypothetical protein OIF38_08725, partial [Cellvibrionaceae bacterium]|nr:hypothetical protein [Cellvibrionaceae bacterium]